MRIAKPILLVTTPVGVIWGMWETYEVSPGMAFLMGTLIAFIGVAVGIVVGIARREQREERERALRASTGEGAAQRTLPDESING